MPLITRLYVWSLVFESLLFFLIGTPASTGVSMNFGRILQIVVVLCALTRAAELFLVKKVRFSSVTNRNYLAFLSLALLSGVCGMAFGVYDVPPEFQQYRGSGVSAILNSAYVRPLFEYFIYAYYFIYFVVLPKYFLKDERDLRYFFRAFSMAFLASFVIGWIDLLLQASGTGLFLPRDLFGMRDVGLRYHGLAGEPRDAVVYLFFGLAMLHLRQYVTGERLTRAWIAGIVAAALMTQSASGMVGIVFFLGMYAMRSYFTALTLRKVLLVPLAVGACLAVLYAVAMSNPRIGLYLDLMATTYDILRRGEAIPPLLAVQVNNVFPIYKFVTDFVTFNLWPVLVGSGLGSSSSINLVMGAQFGLDIWSGVTNPHSQLVRLVFECGLLGTYLFYRAFVAPVEKLGQCVGKARADEFIVMMLLVLGCFFAHRNSAAFIYLGLFVAVAYVSFPRRTWSLAAGVRPAPALAPTGGA